MIKWSGGKAGFADEINAAFKKNPFACRIVSLYGAYPPNLSFADYWTLRDPSGRLTGAIARSGDQLILLLSRFSDLEETAAFIDMTGARTVLCDGAFPLPLTGCRLETGRIMFRTEGYDEAPASACFPPIREAYSLISACAEDGFMPPPFGDFYPDLSHRLRHGSSTLLGIRSGGKLASVCMTVAESGACAVLGAAACSPQLRRQGFGSAVVRAIVNTQIERGRTVFLHRAENKNAAFYDSLGFAEWGVWREYRKD